MKIYSIYFSPTGTSAKVAEAVACGIAEFIEGAAIENCDYTHRAGSIVAGDGDIAVIAAPVYGGHMAAPAKMLADGISGEVDASWLKDVPSPEQSLQNFRKFVAEYQKMQAESPRSYLPEVNTDRCSGCGTCAEVCPTGAIYADGLTLDATMCIKCCACVKSCPEQARTFYTPFAKALSENFSTRKEAVYILAAQASTH